MLSNPPATTTLFNPKLILIAPKATDFNAEEQTLLIVVQGTFIPIPFININKIQINIDNFMFLPPPRLACLAGF